MTRELQPMDDSAFDRMLRVALRREAERVAATQPDASTAAARFAVGLAAAPAWQRSRPIIALAWLLLLLLAGIVTAIVGGPLFDRPAPLEAGPLGLGRPCGEVGMEAGALVTISAGVAAYPGSHVVTYFENGLVTEVMQGNLGLTAPGRPRGLAMMNTFVYEGRLSAHGLSLVRDRIAGLDLGAGCYSVRLPTRSIHDGTLAVRTPDGPALVTWSEETNTRSMDPLLSARDAQLVLEILRDLREPDPNRTRDIPDLVGTWLPSAAWVAPLEAGASTWLGLVTFTRTGYPPTAVLQQPSGPPASATDGRFAAIELPGDATLHTFGVALSLRVASSRCALLGEMDARELARSLDAVELGVDAEADLYTPDMAWGIDIELMPARTFESCATLEARLREQLEGGPPSAVRPSDGDLAAIDPCTLVPADVRGEIQDYGYRMPEAPLGVAARSCLIERRVNMGTLRSWTALWLYPRTVAEADAATLASAVFGDRVTTLEIAGRPAWMNDCLAAARDCTGGIATWVDGRFVLVEIASDVVSLPERTRRAVDTLERIVTQLPGA